MHRFDSRPDRKTRNQTLKVQHFKGFLFYRVDKWEDRFINITLFKNYFIFKIKNKQWRRGINCLRKNSIYVYE